MVDREGPAPRRSAWFGPAAAALAGPVLIVATVLFLLRDFAFGGLTSAQHPDILQAWLPFHCFLGKSLAAGHIPAWNPHAMGGVPFAADPQSGWMYVPAMALYAALPCHAAVGWFVVLQPIVAGLGIWWFLRIEGLSRPAAATGGLVLAMLMAGSALGLELPFAGTLAWTALLLASAARLLRAGGWPGRSAWVLAAAACWGQVAAAHLSDGLVVASLTLGTYVLVRLGAEVRAGRRPLWGAVAVLGLLVVALPMVNLAILLPRLAYLPRTSIGQGYDHLRVLQAQLLGRPSPGPKPSPFTFAEEARWPLGLMVSPGSYLGAAAGAVAFAALWTRRHRSLMVAFAALALGSYVASLRSLASALGPHIGWVPFRDFYLHAPLRFRYGTVLALVVLIGLGLDTWLRSRSGRERVLMLIPGVVVWWVLPVALGVTPLSSVLVLGLGLAALSLGGVAFAGSKLAPAAVATPSRRAMLAALIPAALAIELLANGIAGQRAGPPAHRAVAFAPLRRPTVDAAAYVRPGPLALPIRTGDGSRYLTWTRSGLNVFARGALSRDPAGWDALANQRSMLFGLPDVDGYSPTQLLRFWTFERAVQPMAISYNAAYLVRLEPLPLDLLDVGWVIARAGADPPVAGAEPVASTDAWRLYRLPPGPPRAALYMSWRTADSPADALAAVTAPGFDPTRDLVVEGPAPSTSATPVGSSVPGGSIDIGPQEVRVDVVAARPGMVLIRTPFDPHWHAAVDGRPAAVFAADSLLQAIPVPAGSHRVVLTYDDPTIGYGLLGSAAAVAVLLGAALGIGSATRTRREAWSSPVRDDGVMIRTQEQREGRGDAVAGKG